MKDTPSYKDAMEEIQTIVDEIEQEGVDIDILAAKVKRATDLIKYCRDKLKKTDRDVKTVLEEFEKSGEEKDS